MRVCRILIKMAVALFSSSWRILELYGLCQTLSVRREPLFGTNSGIHRKRRTRRVPGCPRPPSRRIYSTGQDADRKTLEVAVDVHALVQDAHDIDDAVGRDPAVQGV